MGYKPKDQIAYIPQHVPKNIGVKHKDVEFGFVTSTCQGIVFCRYWTRGAEGLDLRTLAKSESTPIECVERYDSATHEEVERAIRANHIPLGDQ